MRFRGYWVVTVVIGLWCNSHLASAQQKTVCSASSLQGSYGFTVVGSNTGIGAQYAISGRFESDARGSLRGSAVQSVNGKISHDQFTATYQVAPDCSGAATLVFDNEIKANLSFTIVLNGDEILMIISDSGTIETGSAKKQFVARS